MGPGGGFGIPTISVVTFFVLFSVLQVPLITCSTVSVSEASPAPSPLFGLLGKSFLLYLTNLVFQIHGLCVLLFHDNFIHACRYAD